MGFKDAFRRVKIIFVELIWYYLWNEQISRDYSPPLGLYLFIIYWQYTRSSFAQYLFSNKAYDTSYFHVFKF